MPRSVGSKIRHTKNFQVYRTLFWDVGKHTKKVMASYFLPNAGERAENWVALTFKVDLFYNDLLLWTNDCPEQIRKTPLLILGSNTSVVIRLNVENYRFYVLVGLDERKPVSKSECNRMHTIVCINLSLIKSSVKHEPRILAEYPRLCRSADHEGMAHFIGAWLTRYLVFNAIK